MANGSLLPSGFLSTSGNQIVDASGTPVRIASVGWNENFSNIPGSIAAIKAAGFNCVRVSWVNATMDSDLQRIDQVVAAASAAGIKVILDHHTDEAGTPRDGYGSQQINGLPYDLGGASDNTNGAGVPGTVTLDRFKQDWVTVAQRYAGNPTVVGFDLDNEPLEYQGASTWGTGDPNTDLQMIYSDVGAAIQAVNPGPLIIAEGPQNYGTAMPWGDLSRAGSHPVRLPVANKVVYSIHDYPQTISGWSPDSGAQNVAEMNAAYGYLVTQNIAPVWIGEMGASLDGQAESAGNLQQEQAWAQTLVDYMNGKLGALGGPTFTGNQQGVSGDWWAWGNLEGQWPDGTQNPDGTLREGQMAVWSQTLYQADAGQVTPNPTPAPSPDKTVILEGGAIVDTSGNTWGITNGVVMENGTAAGYSAGVTHLAFVSGAVWQENTAGLWWQWGGSGWQGDGTSTDPVTGGTPTPTPTTSPGGPGDWIVKSINGMQYMVLLPAGYDPTVKYAVTLYLHQLDNGSYGPAALQQQIDAWFNTGQFRTDHPGIIVAPLLDQSGDLSGNTLNFGGVSDGNNPGEVNSIAALRQVLADYSTDPTRVYVTGNSMGGIGTDEMLIDYNAYTGTQGRIFAAGLSLAGADYVHGFPQPDQSVVAALRDVPFWAIHGGGDTQVPLAFDQNLFAAEQSIGGVMRFTQDNNYSHDVWDHYYPQTGPDSPLSWLFSQHTGSVVNPTPPPTPPPTATPSPDNTVVLAGSGGSIVDASGNTWTIVDGIVRANGQSAGYSGNVTEIAYEHGTIWQENGSGLWWAWDGSSWPGAGTSTSPVQPTPPPLPDRRLEVLTADNDSLMLPADAAGTTNADGDVFSLTGGGVAAVALAGFHVERVTFYGFAGVAVQGGPGQSMITATTGSNTFVAGSGLMDVTGGPGGAAYLVRAGAGTLNIEDFNPAKGDSLSMGTELQAGTSLAEDGTGGTRVSFAGGSVDIRHVTSGLVIHWT